MRGELELETLTSVREKLYSILETSHLTLFIMKKKHIDVADCFLFRSSVQVQSGLSQEWGRTTLGTMYKYVLVHTC